VTAPGSPAGGSRTFWCDLAWIGGEVKSKVLITVAAGRVSAIACGVKPRPADAEYLAGLTVPGLANVHSHAFHRALRGRTQVESGTFWTWRERMYAAAAHLDPDSYRELATAVFAEMALAGVTAVGEFHYLHHSPKGGLYPRPACASPCWTRATWPAASTLS
jgi:cytosine/adenosine deaminase-related metal-dependent hydrolase